ncbi:hypothetical protein B0H16DRAFT_1798456 [Mycena metata]|uniref:NmrA-like domain-containing protein n=1 Tax=Mycena metata TaxID=1033252 RepID=A0AAD7JK25_9AGAR|nr:hypothetical protein B0H16DRAFT_1798456 [Mycena metata]
MATYKLFAVVGGGTVGLHIATGLAAQNVSVILLSRSLTKTPHRSAGHTNRFASPFATVLKEHKVDVVISAINAGSVENTAAQKPVVDAAKAAAVKLYVPSEFGCPSDGWQTEGFLGVKNKVAEFPEYAKSVGLPSARIYTGLFTEYIPFLTGYNTNGKIRVIGKDDTPVSFTSIPDITGFVVHALTALPPSELENRTLRLEGDRATLNELAPKFNTSVEHVDSVTGEGGDFVTHLLELFEAGAGSSGWDQANKKEVSEGAASGNLSWPGHQWKTIKEVHNL